MHPAWAPGVNHVLTVAGAWGRSTVECRPGELLLDAMVRQGLPVAYCCKAGLCGMCKARLHEGVVDQLAHSERALSTEDTRKGEILTCRTMAASDCLVEPVHTLEAADRVPGFLAKVVSVSGTALGNVLQVELRTESAAQLSRFRTGHWARMRTMDHDGPAHLACYLDQGGGDPPTLLMAVRGPVPFGNTDVYLEGPLGQPVDDLLHQGPFVLAVDGHGVPLIEALRRRIAGGAAPPPVMTTIVRLDACLQIPSAAWPGDWTIVTDDAQLRAMRDELKSHADRATASGARLRLLVRGAPAFQSALRKLVAGTGIRAWDVITENSLDLSVDIE